MWTGEETLLIDRAGRTLAIPSPWKVSGGFSEGLAAVSIGKKWGFIDTQGKTVIAAEYDHALDFSEGIAPVGQGGAGFGSVGAWSYIDTDGKTVIPAAYSTANPFQDGTARVAIGESIFEEKFFYIDRKGRPLPKLPGFLVDAKTDFSAEKRISAWSPKAYGKRRKVPALTRGKEKTRNGNGAPA